jgi:hypothetical protein
MMASGLGGQEEEYSSLSKHEQKLLTYVFSDANH